MSGFLRQWLSPDPPVNRERPASERARSRIACSPSSSQRRRSVARPAGWLRPRGLDVGPMRPRSVRPAPRAQRALVLAKGRLSQQRPAEGRARVTGRRARRGGQGSSGPAGASRRLRRAGSAVEKGSPACRRSLAKAGHGVVGRAADALLLETRREAVISDPAALLRARERGEDIGPGPLALGLRPAGSSWSAGTRAGTASRSRRAPRRGPSGRARSSSRVAALLRLRDVVVDIN